MTFYPVFPTWGKETGDDDDDGDGDGDDESDDEDEDNNDNEEMVMMRMMTTIMYSRAKERVVLAR